MEIKTKIVCQMEKEEVATIEKAADIMSDICYAYIEENGCSDCPMREFCKRITTDERPYSLMYDLWSTLMGIMEN